MDEPIGAFTESDKAQQYTNRMMHRSLFVRFSFPVPFLVQPHLFIFLFKYATTVRNMSFV